MLPLLVMLVGGVSPAAPPQPATQPTLVLRLEKEGWGDAPMDNAEAVFRSVGQQLLPHFPNLAMDPINVSPRGGPITLFRRGKDNAHIVRLDTTDTRWAQYAFQFAHELGHILCGYDPNNTGQLWFEESLCEVASLYALRGMSRSWATHPPYRNWKDYAPHLAKYAQERIDGHPLSDGQTLAQWYRANRKELEKDPTDRKRNTTVAVALLPLFEKTPQHWGAVASLNKGKPRQKQSFEERLQNWHDQAPEEHRAFIREVATLFQIELKER